MEASGFGNSVVKKVNKSVCSENSDVATAAMLVSTDETHKGKPNVNCIFCEKPHLSFKCFKAEKMNLNDKRKLILKKGACFSCLKIGHLKNNCKSNVKCHVCNENHFKIMCPQNPNEKCEENSPRQELSLANSSRKNSAFLQTLHVNVKVQGQIRRVRALLDSGSERSYVGERTMSQMKAKPIRKEKMIHGLFGGKETKPVVHSVYLIEVHDLDSTFKSCFEVFSERKICGYVPEVNDSQILEELRNKNIKITDSLSEGDEIELLIGADVIGRLLTGDFTILTSGLTAYRTKLGWTIFGKHDQPSNDDNVVTILSLHVSNASLKDLWELETLGISDPIESSNKKKAVNEEIVNFQDKLSILPDGRYELELPWKCETQNLSDNRELALVRHKKMMKRVTEANCLTEYQDVFREWENLNIIERVPMEELNKRGYFLPHRPVVKMNSETTKIRPVFDASACERGRASINQCLYKGANLMELIPDILDRFRLYPIGLSADIEKAFLQLGIAPKDRDYLRFFFPCENDEVVYRHCRVVFGVSSSPYLLNASIQYLLDHCSSEFADITSKLKNSFYVDNCITGVFNIDDVENFIENATMLLSRGCFNLRGWESNVASKTISKHSGDTSLLGMLWNLDDDTLKCNINISALSCKTKISKRFILSTVQKIFDPIGLLAPVTLLPKLMLQDSWKLKISWDEELPLQITNKFYKWANEILMLKDVSIPRYVGETVSECHVFVDACQWAYAACAFIRTENSSGIQISLLRAKSRVAPLKKLSIPRLELMACCIGARLASAIRDALNLPNLHFTFWCDSTVALWWIKEHGDWSVFVANRVKEIRSLTQCEAWRHVPGNKNPADLLSRGCSPKQLISSGWCNGPEWLKESSDSWPFNNVLCHTSDVDLERKKLSNVNLSEESLPWYALRVSDYDKMICVIGWVLRFINNCRKVSRSCKDSELSLSEIENSEKMLIRSVQQCHYTDLNSIDSLEAFFDKEGIVRVKTRITERKDKPEFLAPVLLPGKSVLTKLLIESFHKKNCHAGTQVLQSILREKFWITNSRRTIRSVLNKCVYCRRHNVKPMLCEPTSLPADRTEDSRVFEIIGVDLAGPLFLKNGEKVWIALFTCAVYRAIHLELVNTLSADSFLLALRRFIARRGRPKTIYSDNGTNFRGAFNELHGLDWEKILRKTKIERISWKFNPPTASWWGGWWERLVRMIKELLRRTLGKSVLSREEFETVICSCESIINSRPLTYVSEDSQDLIPLTPSMFLMENRCSYVTDIDEIDSKHLRKGIRYRAKLLGDLKGRFRKEYLGQLIQKHSQNKCVRDPKVGEIVLVGDDFKKRLYWPLAKVIELIPGRDGNIRTVKLKTQTGVMVRPVQRIFPLEISLSENHVSDNTVPADEVIKQKFSSFGRCIKAPNRLDLFSQTLYHFESLSTDSKGGEDVAKNIAD